MTNHLIRIKDEDLQSRLNAVRAMIRRARKASQDTVEAEKELCWLEREDELRDIRRQKHEQYLEMLKQQQQEKEKEFQEEQEALLEYE